MGRYGRPRCLEKFGLLGHNALKRKILFTLDPDLPPTTAACRRHE